MIEQNEQGFTDQEANSMSISRVNPGRAVDLSFMSNDCREMAEAIAKGIMEGSNDLILIYDSTGRVQHASNRACAYLGYTAVEITSLTVSDIIRLKPGMDTNLLNYLGEGRSPSEAMLISSSKSLIPVE